MPTQDPVLSSAMTAISLPIIMSSRTVSCLLYTSDAADERSSVDLGGRRIIKKKHRKTHTEVAYQNETLYGEQTSHEMKSKKQRKRTPHK